VAYTGGTIGMKKTGQGFAPASGYLQAQMAAMPAFKSDDLPDYNLHEYAPLLDSAFMTPANWQTIAQDIAAHYDQYDGFVVLHGTDTMAYTASALSFILEGLQKPVIITGSQIPLCELRNDAGENLITAMLIAANFAIPEVCIYFNDKLLRGCRATKINGDSFDAFASPNFQPLGAAGIEININWSLVLAPPETENRLAVAELSEPSVSVLRLFPGIQMELIRNTLQPPLKGLVLETYGVGSGPTNNEQFLGALQEATGRGVVIVGCSQCLTGAVNLMEYYITGSDMARAGVLSGYDLTTEAALAKMFYLFSQNLPVETIKELMQTNLRGELTLPHLISPN
jgi:L-asparaginase